ncbi:hypothetical protein Q765_09910 [Flavobacterium rivuli WB 3.3-2 = DSM 21788]|uniref:Gliding motility protein GldL-like N-terminal domain-containing protein n=1 Tax=Flavobacterium rivuli WB 3.3-2 = DSM 21788 TaxID=1121895 RepID=A0A0A2M4I8_9FLAO|nr:hypothetical protein Q765_09910 [Flavobacterium rivuli WB 3.3-2 = DSM 21788]
MRKIYYILAYIIACFMFVGYLFKLMHWPYASMLLISGITLLTIGFLPLYLYNRYKNGPK